MAQVDFRIEPAFSRAAAAHHQGVQIAAVLPAVQPHADVLGEDAVLKRVFRPVLLVHGSGVAPFGRTVFFAPSVIAPGREVNPDPQPIGGNKNEDSFYAVLTPHQLEWIVHCRRQTVHNLRKAT